MLKVVTGIDFLIFLNNYFSQIGKSTTEAATIFSGTKKTNGMSD